MSTLWDLPNSPVNAAASVANQTGMNAQAALPGPLPVKQSLTSTAETLIASALNAAVALTTALGPDTAIEQTIFNFVASGIITTTASGTLTINLYEGAAIASGNLLKSSGAVTQNSATAAFYIKAELIFDSVTGTLAGSVKFYINKTIVAEATLANFVTGFLNQGNPSANPPTLANLPLFSISVTSSGAAGGTPTTVNVQKFSCG